MRKIILFLLILGSQNSRALEQFSTCFLGNGESAIKLLIAFKAIRENDLDPNIIHRINAQLTDRMTYMFCDFLDYRNNDLKNIVKKSLGNDVKDNVVKEISNDKNQIIQNIKKYTDQSSEILFKYLESKGANISNYIGVDPHKLVRAAKQFQEELLELPHIQELIAQIREGYCGWLANIYARMIDGETDVINTYDLFKYPFLFGNPDLGINIVAPSTSRLINKVYGKYINLGTLPDHFSKDANISFERYEAFDEAFAAMKDELDQKKPVIIAIDQNGRGRHYMLLFGFIKNTETFFVLEPSYNQVAAWPKSLLKSLMDMKSNNGFWSLDIEEYQFILTAIVGSLVGINLVIDMMVESDLINLPMNSMKEFLKIDGETSNFGRFNFFTLR